MQRLATIIVLVSTVAVRADPEQCRQAIADYNEMVIAINAAVADYRRCVVGSLARDDCGAEFIELQLTHRDFEAVDERAAKCRGISQ